MWHFNKVTLCRLKHSHDICCLLKKENLWRSPTIIKCISKLWILFILRILPYNQVLEGMVLCTYSFGYHIPYNLTYVRCTSMVKCCKPRYTVIVSQCIIHEVLWRWMMLNLAYSLFNWKWKGINLIQCLTILWHSIPTRHTYNVIYTLHSLLIGGE